MYLRYRNYTYALGEAAVATSREPMEANGIKFAVRERWTISGMLCGGSSSAAEMDVKIRALIAAYATDGGDIAILLPDGSISCRSIRSADTIGGVQVVQQPSFPGGGGAQGVTYQNYTIAVEAILPVVGLGARFTISFRESLRFSGGGPRFGFLEPAIGMPVKQLLRRNTIFRIDQQGEAVGLWGYPSPMVFWPAALVEAPEMHYGSPRKIGGSYWHYPMSWSCRYESATQLTARPHLTAF
jgi:hypothetical protein